MPDPGEAGILYRDEWLAVVDKPAGLVVHAAPSHTGETLVGQLGGILEGGSDPDRPGIVHRLDRDTSGLMVVSLRDEVMAELQGLIRSRRLSRRYLALVSGEPESDTGTIEAPIGRSSRQRHKMTVGGSSQRDAVTHFEVIERLGRSTLIQATLETGRTHQIRVHMAAIGHPVIADGTYGSGPVEGLARQFLHSHRIEFPHPRTGEAIEVASELPGDLASYLENARMQRANRP